MRKLFLEYLVRSHAVLASCSGFEASMDILTFWKFQIPNQKYFPDSPSDGKPCEFNSEKHRV